MTPLGNNRWAKQAYAFVHMCLYGQRGKWTKPFMTFLMRAAKAPVTEEMFKECFGITYKAMALNIRGYVSAADYKHMSYRAKKGESLLTPKLITLREATQSEVGRIKGEALVIVDNKAKARTELIAPYIRGERDPRLLAALGLYETTDGQEDRAKKFLEAAVKAKVVRPAAYVELARMRYEEAMAAPGAPDKRFSAEQVNGIMDLLRTARKQPGPSVALFELAADTWSRSAIKPTQEDAYLVVEGVQLFPTRLRLNYQAALICEDIGLLEAAHSLVDYAIRVTPDSPTKKRFQDLKAALAPEPPSKEPAAPKPQPASTTKK